METMGILGFVFGMAGVVFGMSGIRALNKIDALENKLKETGILDKDYYSS